jgi:hypothetical protein
LPPLSLSPPCYLPPFRQNLFSPPLLQFCWRENIRDNKKDIAFLLVWDKDSYTERFLALLPCTCVLQPNFSKQWLFYMPQKDKLYTSYKIVLMSCEANV